MDIQEGIPIRSGLYVAYVNGPVEISADRVLLMWFDGQWFYPKSDQAYRGHIYGYLGPLPVMPLTA